MNTPYRLSDDKKLFVCNKTLLLHLNVWMTTYGILKETIIKNSLAQDSFLRHVKRLTF